MEYEFEDLKYEHLSNEYNQCSNTPCSFREKHNQNRSQIWLQMINLPEAMNVTEFIEIF